MVIQILVWVTIDTGILEDFGFWLSIPRNLVLISGCKPSESMIIDQESTFIVAFLCSLKLILQVMLNCVLSFIQ